MSTFVNTIDILGDDAVVDSIINRNITEYKDNNIKIVGQNAFVGCKSLTTVDLPNVQNIKSAAFAGCNNLKTIILRSTEVVKFNDNYTFSRTLIASGTGYIYVPSALVDSYKADTNLSTYANQIRAIEDYPEVCDPYTWESVFKNIDNGTYQDVYKVGDLVPLDLGSEGTVNMEIIAFDTDDLADGSGKAAISWISKTTLKTSHNMNPNLVTNDDGTYQEGTGSIGGWPASQLRKYLQSDVKTKIPDYILGKIKKVSKISSGYDATGTKVEYTSNDDIWIPSHRELGIKKTYSSLYEQNGIIYQAIAGNQQVIKKNNDYWLRTPKEDIYGNIDKTFMFLYIDNRGVNRNCSCYASNYIVIGFCT